MMRLMVRSDAISEELWAILSTVVPTNRGRQGRPWNDHRRTLEGIIWRFRTGSPWRDLPQQFGAYQSVWQRHRLWSTDGTYAAMMVAVGEHADLDQDMVTRLLSIDSTSIRAHQHAAGAARVGDLSLTGGRTE